MTQHTHQTAPTQFAAANGIRFAYRRSGKARGGAPLVFMQHFRGGMDHWDPAVTDGFAGTSARHPVRQCGGCRVDRRDPGHDRCDGRPPPADLIGALGLAQIDLLGFSIGGYIAQTLAARRPELIRGLILAGTGPRAG